MYVPAADDEYPSVFLALLTNRHRGVSGKVNLLVDEGDDIFPSADVVVGDGDDWPTGG